MGYGTTQYYSPYTSPYGPSANHNYAAPLTAYGHARETYDAPIDLTDGPPQQRSRKRKSDEAVASREKLQKMQQKPGKSRARDEGKPKQGKSKDGDRPKKAKAKDEEKRLRRYRDKAPQSYAEIRYRALTQRMFVVDRQRHAQQDDSPTSHPTETVTLAGTTGNVYTITIDKVPSCNCPHAEKGNQCKHVVYVMARVLRAPEHLEYQLALLSSELRDIFNKAPPLPTETGDESTKDGNRKPLDDPCPICFEDFNENSKEDIVYCKAACGNNIHKECFRQWAATKQNGAVTCPFCRTHWASDEESVKLGMLRGAGRKNAEGYVNVAGQLGLSGRRDYSTYNEYWVRQQERNGNIDWR